MLGPPWHKAPPAYSLHGRRLRTATPSTVALAQALQVERPILGAVSVLLELTDDRGLLMELLLDPGRPRVDRRLIDEVADDVMLACTGWHRWTAQRLWERTLGAWPMIGGRLLADGVDVAELPFSQASAAVYATWLDAYRRAPDEWRKWQDGLFREPPRKIRRDIERASAQQAEEDFAAMQAMMAQSDPTPGPVDSTIVMPESDTLNAR